MHSERCAPIVRHFTFRLCWIFILINKVEGSQNIKESKTFYFCVDCNIVHAKLVFVPRSSVVSDALIQIGVGLQLNTKLERLPLLQNYSLS